MPRVVAALVLAGGFLSGGATAAGQELQEATPAPAPAEAAAGPLALIGREARLYFEDSKALFLAPFHWNGSQIRTAVGAGALVGGFMIFDERLAQDAQSHSSAATNRMSKIVTPVGDWAAWATSGALIVSGLASHDTKLTSTGREAVEACLIAGLMTDILKPALGRERPYVSDNETVYKPLTRNYSFPSGHATVAFAFASVVAARSDGWLIPTVSYTLASLVAYSRVNDAQHFPSDVVAGGIVGAAVGRFIVHRHEHADAVAVPDSKVELSVYPIHNGLGVAARF